MEIEDLDEAAVEIKTMALINSKLKKLTPEARKRVVTWLIETFADKI